MSDQTVAAALRHGAAALAAAGVAAPTREARLLLAHALDRPADTLLDRSALVPTAAYEAALSRRMACEPFAHISGRQGFWTLDLAVSPATLIPRPDTETLIEALLAARPDRASVRRILDLGLGTGALLLAALAEYPAAIGVGVDIVPDAAALARANAVAHGLSARTMVLAGNWLAALDGRFDVVLANPPYIATAELDRLMPEVARHEPRTALDGGPEGLACYRTILPDLSRFLSPGGIAVFEVGAGQAEDVAAIGTASGLQFRAARSDLGGVPRAVLFEKAVTGDEKSFGIRRQGR